MRVTIQQRTQILFSVLDELQLIEVLKNPFDLIEVFKIVKSYLLEYSIHSYTLFKLVKPYLINIETGQTELTQGLKVITQYVECELSKLIDC